MIRLLALLCGFVSLGSEVALSRSCQLQLGNTSLTLAAVLAAYLAGLAIGAAVASRAQRPSSRSLAYALLILGGSLLLVPRLLGEVARLPIWFGEDPIWSRLPLVVGLLLLPALGAGAAFPALVRCLGADRDRQGGATGTIYAWETAGAVLGSLLCGFVLYRSLGLLRLLDLLAVLALLGAVAGWRLGAAVEPEEVPDHDPAAASPDVPHWRPLLALFLAGAATLGLELLWTRILLFFVPGLISALAAVLAGILLGTSIGARLGGFWAARGGGRRTAVWFLLLAAAGVAVALAVLPVLAQMVRWLPRPTGGGFRPGAEMLVGFCCAALLALASTVCSGAALPLVTQAVRAAGRAPARAYAWSSAGSVFGVIVVALVAGVVLSLREAVVACGLLFLVAGLFAWCPRRDPMGEPVVAVAVAVLLLLLPRTEPLLAWSVEFQKSYARDRTILATDQDRHVVASVVDLGGGRGRALYTNSFQAASTGHLYGYMRMLGHLPVLLADDPSRVLVIAYGTGTTAGAVSCHAQVGTIEIAELSPAVMRLASWFDDANQGVPHRTDAGKQVRVLLGDGRATLESARQAYDVITLEPLPPDTPAAVHFYTTEFYQDCRDRLTEGGVVCQWIPLHAVPTDGFRVLLRTFAEVLDGSCLFLFDQSILLLGGSSHLERFDLARLTARAAEDRVRQSLEIAGVEGPAALLGAFICGRSRILEKTSADPVMGDDRPLVALGLARPALAQFHHAEDNARFLFELLEDSAPVLDPGGLEVGSRGSLKVVLERSRAAKSLLLEARFRPGEADLLRQRALVLSPGDLEARRALGLPDRDSGSPAGGAAEPAGPRLEQLLRDGSDDPQALERALEAAGRSGSIAPLLLLGHLDDDRLRIRMTAMVALKRRIGDIRPYDPAASRAARREAIEVLRRRLR